MPRLSSEHVEFTQRVVILGWGGGSDRVDALPSMRVETQSLPTGTQGSRLHGRVEVCAMWAWAYGGKFQRRQKLSKIKFIKHVFLEPEKLQFVSRDNAGKTGVFRECKPGGQSFMFMFMNQFIDQFMFI